VTDLAPGDHLHLDALLADAPPPGSLVWLPIIDDLIEVLTETDLSWFVALPLGSVTAPPEGKLTIDTVAAIVDSSHLAEPPAAHRARADTDAETFDGDLRRTVHDLGGGVVEVVTVSRSAIEVREGEPWTVQVGWAIEP
jgi:hypothetical protein